MQWRKSSKSTQIQDCVELAWRKSSYSGQPEGHWCVETAPINIGVAVRDSKAPDMPHVNLSASAFTNLVEAIKAGRLDL